MRLPFLRKPEPKPLDRWTDALSHLAHDVRRTAEGAKTAAWSAGGKTKTAGWLAVALPLLSALGSKRHDRTRSERKPGRVRGRRAKETAARKRKPAAAPIVRAAVGPRRGRIDAIGWLMLAGVILAWPRERSVFDWPKLSLPDLFRFGPSGPLAVEAETATAEALEPGRGRAARYPAQIPVRGWKDILWRAWTEFNADNIPQVSGGVAFFGLLAIFPAMAAFVSLYGLFSDVETARKQLRLLAGVLPADALTLIGDQMVRLAAAHHAGLGFAFVIGLLFSLWSANAGVKALFVGLNVSFEEKEKRNLVKLNLVSLAFTLGMLLFLLLAIGAVVVVPAVLAFVGYGGSAMPILRWPLVLVCAIILLALLYRYGPSRERERWRWLSWGSVIAALLWLVASLLFSLYVSNFAHYDRTYGSLGAVIGFMSWLWISTICVLFGAEVNAEIEHQTAVDTTTGKPEPMGRRGARMADTLGRVRPPKGTKAHPSEKATQQAQPKPAGQPARAR